MPPCRCARTPSAPDGTPQPKKRRLTQRPSPTVWPSCPQQRRFSAFTPPSDSPQTRRRILFGRGGAAVPTPLARSAARVAYGGAPVRGGDFPKKHRRHKAVGGFSVCSANASHIPPIGGRERPRTARGKGVPPTAVGGWDSPTIGDCGRKAANGLSSLSARVGFLCSCQGRSRHRR